MSLSGGGSLRAILAAMAALPASRRLLAPVLLCLGLIACSLDPQPEPPLESSPGKNEGGSASYDAGAGKGGSAGSVSHGGSAGSAGSAGEVGAGGSSGSGVSGSAGAAGAAGGGETDGGDPVTDAAGEGGGWTDADPDAQNPDAADGDPDADADGDTDAGADSPIEAESGDDSGDDASPLDAETSD